MHSTIYNIGFKQRRRYGGARGLCPPFWSGPPRGGQWPQRPCTLEGSGLQGIHGLQRAYRNDTDKSVCGRFKTFFLEITSKSAENCGILSWRPFSFLRSHQNPETTEAFSFSVLEYTKPEMLIIWADPGPTFGSRRPWFWLTQNTVFETSLND